MFGSPFWYLFRFVSRRVSLSLSLSRALFHEFLHFLSFPPAVCRLSPSSPLTMSLIAQGVPGPAELARRVSEARLEVERLKQQSKACAAKEDQERVSAWGD